MFSSKQNLFASLPRRPLPYQLSRYSREINEKTLTIKENNKGQIFNQKLTVTEF